MSCRDRGPELRDGELILERNCYYGKEAWSLVAGGRVVRCNNCGRAWLRGADGYDLNDSVREELFSAIRRSVTGMARERMGEWESWLYGIVIGWGEALGEVAQAYGWDELKCKEMYRLHNLFVRAWAREISRFDPENIFEEAFRASVRYGRREDQGDYSLEEP